MLPPALHRLAAPVLHALGLFHPLRDWRRDRRFAAAGRIALKKWATAGRPMPAPDLLKYAVLRDNARRHGLVVLVETGTFYGNAIFSLRNEFTEIHSIELAPDLHSAARRELGHLRHLHLHFGDSAEVLPKVAERITSPALCWLAGALLARRPFLLRPVRLRKKRHADRRRNRIPAKASAWPGHDLDRRCPTLRRSRRIPFSNRSSGLGGASPPWS